jgi:hypothetical protein
VLYYASSLRQIEYADVAELADALASGSVTSVKVPER